MIVLPCLGPAGSVVFLKVRQSGALIHLILRFGGRESDIDWILNVIGFSLLSVMPLVWLLDRSGVAFGFYGATITIPIHTAVPLWEVALMGISFKHSSGLGWTGAIFLGLIAKFGVYIPLAAIFVR